MGIFSRFERNKSNNSAPEDVTTPTLDEIAAFETSKAADFAAESEKNFNKIGENLDCPENQKLGMSAALTELFVTSRKNMAENPNIWEPGRGGVKESFDMPYRISQDSAAYYEYDGLFDALNTLIGDYAHDENDDPFSSTNKSMLVRKAIAPMIGKTELSDEQIQGIEASVADNLAGAMDEYRPGIAHMITLIMQELHQIEVDHPAVFNPDTLQARPSDEFEPDKISRQQQVFLKQKAADDFLVKIISRLSAKDDSFSTVASTLYDEAERRGY